MIAIVLKKILSALQLRLLICLESLSTSNRMRASLNEIAWFWISFNFESIPCVSFKLNWLTSKRFTVKICIFVDFDFHQVEKSAQNTNSAKSVEPELAASKGINVIAAGKRLASKMTQKPGQNDVEQQLTVFTCFKKLSHQNCSTKMQTNIRQRCGALTQNFADMLYQYVVTFSCNWILSFGLNAILASLNRFDELFLGVLNKVKTKITKAVEQMNNSHSLSVVTQKQEHNRRKRIYFVDFQMDKLLSSINYCVSSNSLSRNRQLKQTEIEMSFLKTYLFMIKKSTLKSGTRYCSRQIISRAERFWASVALAQANFPSKAFFRILCFPQMVGSNFFIFVAFFAPKILLKASANWVNVTSTILLMNLPRIPSNLFLFFF